MNIKRNCYQISSNGISSLMASLPNELISLKLNMW